MYSSLIRSSPKQDIRTFKVQEQRQLPSKFRIHCLTASDNDQVRLQSLRKFLVSPGVVNYAVDSGPCLVDYVTVKVKNILLLRTE